MAELCPCSKLEWLPEHLMLEHHPDCEEIKGFKIPSENDVRKYIEGMINQISRNHLYELNGDFLCTGCGAQIAFQISGIDPHKKIFLRCKACGHINLIN
jgi:hypothetical protein